MNKKMNPPVYVYALKNSLYINLCNRCTAHCVFCPIRTHPVVAGYDLALSQSQEPSSSDVIHLLGAPAAHEEIVFCGFGEPTLRLDAVKEIATWVKQRGGNTRLNTNGHGNLIHSRDVTPELRGLIDVVSVSINAADPESYVKIMRPDQGIAAFHAALDFIRRARQHIPSVLVSAVALSNSDWKACERMAASMRVGFRLRPYADLSLSTTGECHSNDLG